jgi:hypothetical protein
MNRKQIAVRQDTDAGTFWEPAPIPAVNKDEER